MVEFFKSQRNIRPSLRTYLLNFYSLAFIWKFELISQHTVIFLYSLQLIALHLFPKSVKFVKYQLNSFQQQLFSQLVQISGLFCQCLAHFYQNLGLMLSFLIQRIRISNFRNRIFKDISFDFSQILLTLRFLQSWKIFYFSPSTSFFFLLHFSQSCIRGQLHLQLVEMTHIKLKSHCTPTLRYVFPCN